VYFGETHAAILSFLLLARQETRMMPHPPPPQAQTEEDKNDSCGGGAGFLSLLPPVSLAARRHSVPLRLVLLMFYTEELEGGVVGEFLNLFVAFGFWKVHIFWIF
jgi:hypothetical protein